MSQQVVQRSGAVARKEADGHRSSRRSAARRETILTAAFGVFLVGTWELVCRGLGVSEILVPAPTQVLLALYQGFETGQLWHATLATLKEILFGFALSAVAALVLGTVISQIRTVEVMIYPYIVALQTLPKIALAPLILVWFGVGIESKIFIAAMVSFFPMLVNNIVGFRAAPQDKIDLMRSLCASKSKIFLAIKLPEALPYIFAGLNIGIVLSVLGAIVGEFIGAKEGLGYQILQMNYNLDTSGVFAALVVLGVMGICFNLIAQFARRRVIFWRSDSPSGY